MRYIGLDVHQRYCEGCELVGPQKKRRRFRFPNTLSEWENFAASLDQTTHVVLEATGNAFWIYDILSRRCPNVVIANPLQLRAIAQARVKTDKLDAEILAQLLAADFIPKTWVPSVAERELRIVVHHRVRLARQRTEVKNKIHATLMRNGLTAPCSDLFGKRGRQFLETVQLPLGEQIVLRSNLAVLQALDQEIVALEGELSQRAKDRWEVKLLLTVPGISVVSAMVLLAEIGDVTRFATAKQLTSYAGLVPSVHQSGKTHYTGRITKTGRSTLRWILVQCALQAVRKPGILQSFYLHLKAKKGGKVAIVAVARKLLSLIWVILNRKEEFRDANEELTARKVKQMHRQAKPYPIDPKLKERLLAFIRAQSPDAMQSPYPLTAD